MQSDRCGNVKLKNQPGRGGRGFTLIEAIVALVLISGIGMAVYGWINTNIISLGRVQAANAENEAMLNVLDYMNSVNPMLTSEGQADFRTYRLSWRAEPVTEVRDGANYPQGIGLYQLALYRTTVSVDKPGGEPWFTMTLRQVGYKKVRQLKLPF